MKRNLSSFDIYVLVSDLQEYIDYTIEKIYQISRNEIIIKIKNIKTKNKESLYIKNAEYLSITKKQYNAPKKPSTFAMTLRKYLTNSIIIDIKQYEFDRIIKIKIKRKETEYYLIIEFFSKGNIILLNSEEKILIPLITQHWSHRKIKTHEKYKFPPSQINPLQIKQEKFLELLKKSDYDLVRTLAVNLNLSGNIAEEICEICNIDKNKKINDLNDGQIKKIFNEFKKFLNRYTEKKFNPVLVKKDEEIIDILPFKFESYKNIEYIKIDNFIKSFEEFIVFKNEKIQKTKINDEVIKKFERRINQQKNSIEKIKKNINEKKFQGEIIYLNFDICKKIINEITKVLELKNKENEIIRINDNNFVKEFNPTNNQLLLNLKDLNGNLHTIKLDFRKTVAENAENAYNEHKKFKIKLKGAEKSLQQTKNELNNAIKNKFIIEQENHNIDKEKKFWFENYRWLISSENNIIIAGKDAKTNEKIVKKYLKQGDRYAHADITGAPSCIIKNIDINNKTIPISEKTLIEACNFCAYFSKAWNQYSEIQSYWVLPEQVSKTPQSGEYVPKGAFIIRGKRNYYKCILEMAIGEILLDDNKKYMSGPIKTIKNHSKKYVILKPGNMTKNVISNIIAKSFGTSSENILKILPPGNISIIESFGIDLDSKRSHK